MLLKLELSRKNLPTLQINGKKRYLSDKKTNYCLKLNSRHIFFFFFFFLTLSVPFCLGATRKNTSQSRHSAFPTAAAVLCSELKNHTTSLECCTRWVQWQLGQEKDASSSSFLQSLHKNKYLTLAVGEGAVPLQELKKQFIMN